MATKQEKRIAEYARLFRVKPGSKVNLGRDFDPGFKADVVRKKDGAELLRRGIALLADYQARLAAQDTYGVLVPPGARRRRQGRDDPPCDERREPPGRRGAQLQGAVRRGARPRLPVALRAPPARARTDRDLQPLPLRGGGRRARPPGEPRPPEAAGGEQGTGSLGAALPGE